MQLQNKKRGDLPLSYHCEKENETLQGRNKATTLSAHQEGPLAAISTSLDGVQLNSTSSGG